MFIIKIIIAKNGSDIFIKKIIKKGMEGVTSGGGGSGYSSGRGSEIYSCDEVKTGEEEGREEQRGERRDWK